MGENSNFRYNMHIAIACGLIYFAVDYSVRITGFLRFGDSIGIKNFLAAILGLVFGVYGVGGCCIGCILAALLSGAFSLYTIYECLASIIVGLGLWCLWHAGKKDGEVFLKKPGDYLRYTLILFVLSLLSGAIGRFILPEHAFLPYFAAYFFLGIVVGIPVLILLTSIVCVMPILPPWVKPGEYFVGELSSDPASLMEFNEKLEEYAMSKKIKMKEIFGVQNCIEEVHIRIQDALPDMITKVSVRFHDSVSIDFEYGGGNISPFRIAKDTSDEELIGLKLILHRSLRSSHRFYYKLNHVHIVM